MLAKSAQITQSRVKKASADALDAAIKAADISKAEAADLIDTSLSSIANRLDRDDPSKPLTLYEFLRGIREFGPDFGNAVITQFTGFCLAPVERKRTDYDQLQAKLTGASHKIARAKADKVVTAEEDDEIKRELRSLLPDVVHAVSSDQIA